ncbi:hypothetical protein SAMN05428945_0618 [Streptomyces sp. 2224.1]|uniref:DUF6879 family protein n=1 Tax=unclassified Streptomyces TaxID=2593676 RepID=UPI000898CD27|nr:MULTISPECIES: DUF6879 family protein [unclassified Streptomyces]SEB61020.1 hypothetical protein SAMN05428945_0618 [Streptomyces sp. 2224.1]SEE40774.1 hypothetical protein SAMN05428954_2540 [Streptomyces sp. 2112.3]
MFLDGDEWRAKFRDFRMEAWRLETLPRYLVPQEAEEIEEFRAGKRIDPEIFSCDYTERLRKQGSEGRRQGRVHVVTHPLSEYLDFEFSRYYRPHVRAGEDIRILDVTDRENPLPEVQDFWMFDRSTVVLMHYEPDGTQISREVYEGDPAPFIEYQRIAVAESVPFLEYVKE